MVSSLEFAVRVRAPFNQQEAENVGLYVDPSSERIVVGNNYSFTADHVFPSNQPQAIIYERFAPKVKKFLEGYDVSFVTFGRSKSGKTHSLVGSLSPNLSEESNEGLITRTALHMFDYLNKAKQTSELNFNVFFSFFETPCDDMVDPNRFNDVSRHKASMEQPMNNNFSSKECNSFDDVVNCLKLVMKGYPFERSFSHTNCFFMLTLHQQLLQAGKILAKSSRCTFVELGSYESMGLNSQVVQHLRFSNAGLNLISKVLSAISEEANSSQISQPFSLLSALLKDIVKYSSATILLFCVPPSSLESSNSLIDLLIIEQLRLLYGNGLSYGVYQNMDKRSTTHDVKLMSHHERDSFKEEALSLEFAASQWQLLVSNAEVLFNKLVQGGLCPDAKGQIEQWLFLKQECEDCFKPGAPGQEKIKCSLDRIDEVTESDGKTSLENSGESEPDNDDSDELDDNHINELTFVQSEAKKREFAEKLGTHLDKFRALTDQIVCEQYNTKFTRMCNEQKTTETKHLCLNKKAASVESLITSMDNCEGDSSKEEKHVKLCHGSDSNTKQIIPVDTDVVPDDDMLRVEIASLRVTKDYLHEQKRELTVKMNETKYITNEEQRKLLEADEAIDAIDSAMEFKNELLCGRSGLPKADLQERGEQMLTERLLNLSPHEMRILLCKYFKKVVDLREAGRKMEKVIADQDHQLETHAFKIHALSNALQQTRVDCERRLIMVRKEQEKKYQLNIHHFGTDSSGASSSVDNKSDNLSSNTGPLFELNVGGASNNVPDKALTGIPQQNLKKLQGPSTHTTKVTRKGNKLIIQQERSKKK